MGAQTRRTTFNTELDPHSKENRQTEVRVGVRLRRSTSNILGRRQKRLREGVQFTKDRVRVTIRVSQRNKKLWRKCETSKEREGTDTLW